MEDREPTVRSRELGAGLRRAMQDAGLTGKQVAKLLDLSPSWVSRLISGKRDVTAVQAAAFLAVCRAPTAERERLLELCEDQHTRGWLQQHGSRLPLQLVTLIEHENKAVTISEFESTVMPGLLQTGEYIRALLKEAGRVPAEEIDDRVAARLARQALFSREPLIRFTFYVHEFALRLPVGGPAVMSEQLDHLHRRSLRPHITLRVVPAALGGHAVTAGSFRLMEFAEFKPVAYLESETSCVFLEKPVEIEAYRDILGALAKTALGERESRELIATLAHEQLQRQPWQLRRGRLAHQQLQQRRHRLRRGRDRAGRGAGPRLQEPHRSRPDPPRPRLARLPHHPHRLIWH